MSYVSLHNHSHFSTLDGLGKIPDICSRAVEIGSTAIAVSDHASLSCLPELMREAKKVGIKPIPGCEFYVVDNAEGQKDEKRIHLSVWAKNWNGVQSILKQLTVANSQFYRRPRITWKQAFDFDDCIIGTACTAGPLSLDDYDSRISALYMTYHKDFYLEIMPAVIIDDKVDMQEIVNKRAIEMSVKYNIPLIATNDAHYVRAEDSHTHEILLAIQTGKSWKDPARWKFSTDEYYIKSEEEMLSSFAKLSYIPHSVTLNAIARTGEIADKVDVEMPKFEVQLPSLYADDNQTFQDKIKVGWGSLIMGSSAIDATSIPAYMERLVYEIGVIKKLGFIKYFLIVEDIINWSRANGIMVGPGRGSAAGSLVCYLMGITQVDPIRFNLFFERFLNPERVDLPDIDVDFADNRRDEVFEYIRNKYGHDKTAKINTFTILGPKNAFRDVCRVFDINVITVNMLSKQIEDEESFEKVGELVKFKNDYPEIVEQTLKLCGTIRAQGVHAAGMVVSSHNLAGICSIEKRGDVEVVNWDKREAENFGLLKIDILGLSTLSILNHAARIIKERHGVEIDFPAIPLDDEKTIESFKQGNGVGIFQFEQNAISQLLRDLSVDTFDIITDATALFRPGPLNSGLTAQYVRVRRGDEYESYPCEELRPILKSTNGTTVYQEQVMMIFNQLGGFTWAESDKMRKIIGKKLGKDEFEKHRQHFVDGCLSNEISEPIATKLFDNMTEFANYVFNKSHAVSYTMLSFWSMYIKVNYPTEFFTAQLSNSSDERVGTLCREAEKYGISIRLPQINLSTEEFTIDGDGNIIPPLGIVKGIGGRAVEEIMLARRETPLGAFLDRNDFLNRVVKRVVNVKIQSLLLRAGAFNCFGEGEQDEETRVKDYSELLPTFSTKPRLAKGGGNMNVEALKKVLTDAAICSKTTDRPFMMPIFAKTANRPSIMIINNPVKKESVNLTSDGTKYIMKDLKQYGILAKDIYYTAPVKCGHNGSTVSKECEGKCLDTLRKEIEAVGPKLIVCFATNLVSMFTGDKKAAMSKLHNTLIFNKTFGCYILFSYSPQYCFYGDGMMPKIQESLQTLGEVFL